MQKEFMSKIEEMNSKIVQMKKELMEEGQKAFHASIKDFFEKHPKIHMFSWVQYTPYFNDGEPCEFGVHEAYMLTKSGHHAWVNESEGYYDLESYVPLEVDWDSYKASDYKNKTYVLTEYADEMTVEEVTAAKKDLDAIMSLPEEVFQALFDDHVKVTVTKDGIDTDEFSHD